MVQKGESKYVLEWTTVEMVLKLLEEEKAEKKVLLNQRLHNSLIISYNRITRDGINFNM